MDQILERQDSNKRPGDVQVRIIKTKIKERSRKCNQCEYASSQASDLRKHLNTHRGGK